MKIGNLVATSTNFLVELKFVKAMYLININALTPWSYLCISI